MAQVIKTTFQLRRGLLETWEKNNPILAKGEPSFVIDKNALKIGDGITPWKHLEYIGLSQEDLAKAIEDYFKENPGSGTGADGRGIVSIIKTEGNGAPGTIDTYTITYTDYTTSTFTVYNGKDGKDGDDGRGIISIEKIAGNGAPGTQDTYQINYSDGSNFAFQIYNGKDGNVDTGYLKRVIVEQLPDVSAAQANTIYMIKKAGGGIASWGKNIYEEYMVIEGEWELLGNSQVDLTDYASTTYVDNAVKNKVDKDGNKVLSTNDYTTAEKNKLANIAAGAEVNVNADWNATSGDAQILNKPTLGSMAAKSSVAKSDLASGVQTSLGKADSALQPGDISAWAKASTKPTYTASEVGAIPAPTDVKVGQYFKVSSVANGKITGIEAVDPWILSDEVTGTKYKLSVVKGKLTMTESEV